MMIDADAVMLLQFIFFIVLSNMTNVIVNTWIRIEWEGVVINNMS